MASRERFVYRGRSMEDINKQQRGDFDSITRDGITTLKVKEGENCVRILPPSWSPEDEERWGTYWSIAVYVHYKVGPDEQSYLCLDKMLGERCPVCEARRGADQDEADEMKPRLTHLCYAIDRDNEKAGVQLWRMPKKQVYDEITTRSRDKKTNQPLLIDDPEKGYDIVFTRTGKDLRTKYTGLEVLRESSLLHDNEKIMDDWLDFIRDNPLPETLNYYSAEHIEKVLYGAGGAPKRDSSRRSARDEDGGRRSHREEPQEDRRERYRAAPEEDSSGSSHSGNGHRRHVEDQQEVRQSRRGEPEQAAAPKDDWPEEQEDSSISTRARERLEGLRTSRRSR